MARPAFAALAVCVCMVCAAVAWAAETLTLHASFHPYKLGAATNFSVTAKFHSTSGGVPSPVESVTAYLPGGVRMDVKGAGHCTAAMLEGRGPNACPADSRIGFGGGVGIIELAKEAIREPFTLDLFLGPREDGHLVVLAFVEAISPTFLELVVVAREVPAQKPYGIGFTFTIPPITTLPEAPDASIESAFISVGERNVAYYEKVGGREKLVHIRGLVLPHSCPHGGFRGEAKIDFADGTTATANPTIPCPHA